MIPRYTRREMGRIWEDQNKYQRWLDVELAVTESLAARGIVPKDAAAEIRAKANFSVDRINQLIVDHALVCPKCGSRDWTDARYFNLMFSTRLSKTAQGDNDIAYLRPETAQAIFVDFKNIIDTMRVTVPFGIGQIGKAFRNEITPGNFIFRVIEFEQMEMQFFVKPETAAEWFEHWRETRFNWYLSLGVRRERLRFHQHSPQELAHYARAAFDIAAESDKTRERYGYTSLGQCALLARRLVEAGSRFVGIDNGSWDTHFSQFPSLKEDLIPSADRAFTALVTDLEDRGLLDSTLVIMMGEMGRTPQINNRAGRDHYARAFTAVLAGGGARGGQAYGQTDENGAIVSRNPVNEGDLFATIYTALGVNPRARHFVGTRPVWATPESARVVRDLLA